MIEKLKKYIDNYFVGIKPTKEAIELKEEMTQNLIDKYNDLVNEGKSEEVAYSMAIDDCGDISEVLKNFEKADPEEWNTSRVPAQAADKNKMISAILISVSVMLYILSIVPVLIFENNFGVILMFVFIAIATGLIVFNSLTKGKQTETSNNKAEKGAEKEKQKGKNPILKMISSLLWLVIVIVYLAVSFVTFAWHITWIIFLIGGCAQHVIEGIFELIGVDK